MVTVANTDEAGFGVFSGLKQQTLERLNSDLNFLARDLDLSSVFPFKTTDMV